MCFTLLATGIIALSILTTGCIPHHRVAAPGISGTILEAETGQPIPGSKVEELSADKKGRFSLSAEMEWGVTFPFVGGHYPATRSFTVTAPGYQSRVCNCTTITPDSECGAVVIPLEKMGGQKTENRLSFIREEEPVGDNTFCTPLDLNPERRKK